MFETRDARPDHPLTGVGVPPDLRVAGARSRVLAPGARLTAEAAAAGVDPRQEGPRAGGRELAGVGIADLEEHPVAPALGAARLDRPVTLFRPPGDLRRRRLLGEDRVGGGAFSAEDGAHCACLVPTGRGV